MTPDEDGGDRIDYVTYLFSTVDGPDIDLRVRRLHWVEGLSHAFEMRLDLSIADTNPDAEALDSLLGASVELNLDRGPALRRTAYGIIQAVEYIGFIEEHLWISVVVVPAFRLLSQRVDTRIFQGETVVEILERILGAELGEFDRALDTDGLKGTYNKRDYCVQFRESTFDFCSRIMEEEGITYHFQSDDETRREKLTLIDVNKQYGDVPLLIDEDVPIIGSNEEEADRESIQRFDWEHKRVSNKMVAWGYNFKKPEAIDRSEPKHVQADAFNPRVRELYMFDDRRQITDDPVGDPAAESFTGEALKQRDPMAKHRLQLSLVGSKTARGNANVASFLPGLFFTLGSHTREDLDGQRFLLTRVIHRFSGAAKAGSGGRYSNSFECIPEANEHRPAMLTPRPRVFGAQTAVVVGPEGEEIHTDIHGRIKVRFHWDRLNPADETASCWTRVAQPWAGPGWGAMIIPRMGMEVVVDFLDGNPDRPLVVGCVYNGHNTPPYPLPAEKTKSTFKSNSSPSNGGFNELRFEDAAGSEEIYTHAEKNYTEVVKNNHNTTVHNCQTNTVDVDQTQAIGQDQTETIGRDQSLTVEQHRTVKIDGSQSVTICGGSATAGNTGSKLEITGDYKVDVSNTIEIQAPTHILLTCGDSIIKMVPGKIEFTTAGSTIVMDGTIGLASAGKSKIMLDGNAVIEACGGGKVALTAAAVMSSADGAAKVDLTGSDALLKGNATATADAPTALLKGSGGKVEATAAVKIAGSPVEIDGGSLVKVTGGEIKLN